MNKCQGDDPEAIEYPRRDSPLFNPRPQKKRPGRATLDRIEDRNHKLLMKKLTQGTGCMNAPHMASKLAKKAVALGRAALAADKASSSGNIYKFPNTPESPHIIWERVSKRVAGTHGSCNKFKDDDSWGLCDVTKEHSKIDSERTRSLDKATSESAMEDSNNYLSFATEKRCDRIEDQETIGIFDTTDIGEEYQEMLTPSTPPLAFFPNGLLPLGETPKLPRMAIKGKKLFSDLELGTPQASSTPIRPCLHPLTLKMELFFDD